jgi:hypothetical protein
MIMGHKKHMLKSIEPEIPKKIDEPPYVEPNEPYIEPNIPFIEPNEPAIFPEESPYVPPSENPESSTIEP